jgi:N-methylhydantoinase A/acetone carboxylase, beta subunit
VRRIPIQNLLREGVVQICGLTPTDIMHIKGDFSDFDKRCSLLGAEYVARVNGVTVDELCDIVYDEIKRKIYLNVINILLETENNDYMTNGISDSVKNLINESYHMAKNPDTNFIKMNFKTDFKLIGIGAPIHIFLDDVAKYLNTEAIIPQYHEVANAVGAIASDIYVTVNVEIKPIYAEIGIIGYTVYGSNFFEQYGEAEAFAIKEAIENADKEAKSRGASGEINVSYEIIKNDAKAKDGVFYLGTNIQAYAVGSI